MKHLFLDLEDTIITPVPNGWGTAELINVQKILKVIDEFKPDFINIYSFAIHNERELNGFNQHARSMVERAIGEKLHLVPRVDEDIIQHCCKVMKLAPSSVNFMEMNNFWGKHEAFRLSCRCLFGKVWKTSKEETEVILLDDVVLNEFFEWPDLHVKGQIINIDSI